MTRNWWLPHCGWPEWSWFVGFIKEKVGGFTRKLFPLMVTISLVHPIYHWMNQKNMSTQGQAAFPRGRCSVLLQKHGHGPSIIVNAPSNKTNCTDWLDTGAVWWIYHHFTARRLLIDGTWWNHQWELPLIVISISKAQIPRALMATPRCRCHQLGHQLQGGPPPS